jgi:hypothetical protein
MDLCGIATPIPNAICMELTDWQKELATLEEAHILATVGINQPVARRVVAVKDSNQSSRKEACFAQILRTNTDHAEMRDDCFVLHGRIHTGDARNIRRRCPSPLKDRPHRDSTGTVRASIVKSAKREPCHSKHFRSATRAAPRTHEGRTLTVDHPDKRVISPRETQNRDIGASIA